uniref:C2H2-type domain-containing protein n=1 Tax=Musca domestica TaxID=7370 RepID=A0A1I8MVP8_MUSDO
MKEMRSVTIGRKRKLDSSADAIKTKLVRSITNQQNEKYVSSDPIQNDVQIVDLDINNQPKQAKDKLINTQSIQEDEIGCNVSSDTIQNNVQIADLDINNPPKQAKDKLINTQSIQEEKIGSTRKSQRIKFESWKLKEMYSTIAERKRKLASSQITNKAELFHSTISNHNKEYSENLNSVHITDSNIDVKPKRLEGKLIFTKTQQFNHNKIAVVRLPKIVGKSIKQTDNNVLSEFKMVGKDLKNSKIDETKRELQHNQKNTARSNVDMDSASKVVVRSFPRIKIETTSANRIKENIPKLKTEIPDNDISPIRKSHRIKTETWKLKEINSMKQTFGRKNKVQQINEEQTTKEPSEENDPFETDDDLNDLDFEIDSPPKRTKLNFKKMKSKTNGRHPKQNHELEINTSNPLNSTALMRPIKSTREEELDNIIAQWKPELDCMVCEKPFATYTLLHEHFKDRHQHKHEFYIQCCGLKIKKRGHLAEHIRIHTDKKAFKCTHCKIRCHRKRNLIYHMRKIHNISAKEIVPERGLNPESSQIKLSTQIIRNNDRFIEQFLPNLECPRCRQIFPVFSKLERHYRKRHKDEEFHILCCGYRLTTQSLLVDHLNRHTHPRKHKCKFCNACFTMQHVMEYHMRVDHKKNSKDSSNDNTAEDVADAHAEVLSIKESDDFISRWLPSLECHVCKEEFKSYSSLGEHFDVHHAEQQSYVTCCDHRFFTRSKLQRHIDGHINSKAFKCQLCGKRYTRNERLEFHMAKQHYGTISSVTSYCEDQPSPGTETQNVLTKRKSLKDLDRTIAQWKPKLECRVCHKTYATFTLFSRHYRDTHPAEQCYISCCGCKFAGRYDIVEHIKYHRDPNAFKCTQCGRCFNRNRGLILHMRTHRN